jgi:hypothetical protein
MKLKVRVRNPQYEVRDRYASYLSIPEYHDFTGEVIPATKRDSNATFRLKDLRSGFIREIPRKDIICGWKF